MPLELVTLPCLSDNYAFLLHDPGTGATACIDVPEAAPILQALEACDWRLTDILVTHHHSDHIGGVAELVAATGARVTGAAADAHRLPPLDRAVGDGDTFAFGPEEVRVYDVSGHTVGHIAFHLPGSGYLFTADSLMAAGCGRLFEGTPAMMWDSLSRLAALPDATLVCSGHEYTASNLRFAAHVLPQDAAIAARVAATVALRDQGRPTVPSTLAEEKASNIFLRAGDPAVARAVGMADAQAEQVFAALRAAKDSFR